MIQEQMNKGFYFGLLICVIFGCTAFQVPQMTKAVDSVMIQKIELNDKDRTIVGPLRGSNPQAKMLIDALKDCNVREIVKYRPKYKIILNYSDNSSETFLILGSFMKVNGLTYRCAENLENVIDTLLQGHK